MQMMPKQKQLEMKNEAKALLSTKRKQAAFKRWGDSDKKGKQRIVATAKTRRKEPLRKSVSTQADLTSAVIEKLHNTEKPLNDEIGRTASLSRIAGIASAFRGNKNRALSFKKYEEASRKVRRRLGILSPAREANETMPKLTPLEDFKICAGRFNGKERRYLKYGLQEINKDFLAPTDKVCALKKKLSSILQVQSSVEKEITTVWLNKVTEVLSDRLNRLHENAVVIAFQPKTKQLFGENQSKLSIEK
uniref:Uncharacterized protein n=1 Tax=Ditylenchus dipsaci TaxID=166011 RepID=A0A915CRZ0_9BILA